MNATLSYYYHYALLSVGSELMAAFETALAPVALSPIAMEAVSLGVSQEQITTFLLPVQSSMHPLYNPDLDYSIYLSQPFFYVLFQILILLITVYIIGSELKFHTAQEWLTTARENILTAVVGKLLPYTFIFSVIGILANYILYGVLHIPFHGSLLMMNLMTILFIIATQTLAVFIFSIFSTDSLYHQHCIHGRFTWCHTLRSHFPSDEYVPSCTCRILPVSCPSFHGNSTIHALF